MLLIWDTCRGVEHICGFSFDFLSSDHPAKRLKDDSDDDDSNSGFPTTSTSNNMPPMPPVPMPPFGMPGPGMPPMPPGPMGPGPMMGHMGPMGHHMGGPMPPMGRLIQCTKKLFILLFKNHNISFNYGKIFVNSMGNDNNH